jgi:hypothetical protein
MTAAEIGALPLACVLLGASFLALWLDRYRLQPLPWLLGFAAWGVALPTGARFLAKIAGWPGPALVLREPTLGTIVEAGAIAVLAVGAPLVVIGSTRVIESVVDGALFGLAGGVGLGVFLTLLPGAADEGAALGAAVVASLACAGAGATLGAGMGLGKLTLAPRRRALGALGALLASGLQVGAFAFAYASCHRAWRESGAACDASLAVIAALVLAAVLVGAARIERRIVARQLGEEVELGVLPGWTVEILPSYLRRIRADWWPRRDERQEIVHLLTVLAFRKQQLLTLSAERLRLYALEVGRLRQRAREVMAFAPHEEAVAAQAGSAAGASPAGEGR